MKRILLALLSVLLLAACGKQGEEEGQQTILEQLNEPIDFSKVQDLDYAYALDAIEAETKDTYVPAFDDMYQAVREYKFNVQSDRAYMQSIYEFEEQGDHPFSTEVTAYYGPKVKRSIFETGKEYMWHLIKKFFNNGSVRINKDGFKGYYTLYGAKMDSRRFYMSKDGKTYQFSQLKRSPKNIKNFDFLEYTIDSMHLAEEYGEWEQLEERFVDDLLLPNVQGYRPKILSFNVHYRDGEFVANELIYTFNNDETNFYFGVYEDGYELDMLSYDYGIHLRNIEEEVSAVQLANGLEVSRHLFHKFSDFKWVIYRWDMDGLHYYLTVKDKRIADAKELGRYEKEFFRLIESIEKP